MAKIEYNGKTYGLAEGESVLDTLLKAKAQVPWSCRAGLCHSCLVQATAGTIPPAAQRGLTPEQRNNQLLLACQCYPQPGSCLALQPLQRGQQPQPAIVTKKRLLTPTLVEITVSPKQPLSYRPGQTVVLSRERGLPGNRYTLISRPWKESDLRIQVGRVVGGRFSSWLFDQAREGQVIWLWGLAGECCFQNDGQTTQIIVGAEQGIGAALAVAEDILWHEQHYSVEVLVHGDLAGHQYHNSLPITRLDRAQLTAHAGTLLQQNSGQQARWLLFGQTKTVLTLANWLIQQGVTEDRVFPLAYQPREPTQIG